MKCPTCGNELRQATYNQLVCLDAGTDKMKHIFNKKYVEGYWAGFNKRPNKAVQSSALSSFYLVKKG